MQKCSSKASRITTILHCKVAHIETLYLPNSREVYVSHPEMYGYLNAMYNADKIIYGYIDNEL